MSHEHRWEFLHGGVRHAWGWLLANEWATFICECGRLKEVRIGKPD